MDRFSEWAPATFSYRVPLEPFFTIEPPPSCESCGGLCTARSWNVEHELWIGTDCSCSVPNEPLCPILGELIMSAETVREVSDIITAHVRTCGTCLGRHPYAPRKVA